MATFGRFAFLLVCSLTLCAQETISGPEPSVDWIGVTKQSLYFLGLEHGARLLAQPYTRDAGIGWGNSYTRSIGNLHGWADGDTFITNYVGHPMQGALVGYIWTQNDPRYRDVEIGRDPRYWKSRLRATAFSFAYSEQFEIGPVSEATIGHVQRDFPQQGFVDHVVTPFIGLGWMLAEDAADKYIVRKIEGRLQNPVYTVFARGMLNPSRSMANMMAGRLPWHREDRPGAYAPYVERPKLARASRDDKPAKDITTLELAPYTQYARFGAGTCIGGGGEAAFRFEPHWMAIAEVGGCKLMDLPQNFSGDSLTYRLGARWTPAASSRWSPYAQVLVGGTKITQEQLFPGIKQQVMATLPANATPEMRYAVHSKYTHECELNGLSMAASSGVDLRVNRALAVRVASLEYTHNWIKRMSGLDYQNSVQFTSGVILRLGTW